jgi:cell division protease FtsH
VISAFPWLPIGTALPNGALSGRRLEGGAGWQLCDAGHGGTVLLLRPGAGPAWWAGELDRLADAAGPLATVDDCLCLACPRDERPHTVSGLALRSPPVGKDEALALVQAVLAMAARQPGAGWCSALFLPGPGLALATAELAPGEDRRATLLAALSGGIGEDAASPARLVQLNTRLDFATARAALELMADMPASPVSAVAAPEGFVLPGQPALELLLREQVLDVLHRPAEYARLGVSWPGGVLLAGPPGCGKSFAAAQLATFLGWTLHEISVAGVGSMWLHETPRQLARAFAQAAASAPGVILLEELDALGRKREGEHGPGVEEVNTLLREVETAAQRRLLVIGTTNRLDAIDRALLRRGRFDLVFTMDYPDAAAAAAMLQALLGERPHATGMDVAAIGRRLARRPASDLAWVVDQAARMAVRAGRDAIDELLLARAAAELAPVRGDPALGK